MSSIEIMNVLSKQWANVNDIQKIGSCGRDKAIMIRNEIEKSIIRSDKRLPQGKEKLVPMQKVVEYFDVNIDYIYSMAKKEKNLK